MRIIVVMIGLFSTGCGPITQDEYVQESAAVLCTHVYACTSDEERQQQGVGDMVGTTASECTTLTAADGGLRLIDDCTYSGESAQICLDELAALNCEQFTSHAYPESCDEICTSGS